MLNNIPKILSPDLLKVLCEMGHSDRIVLADGNFPAESVGARSKLIRYDGHAIPALLEAILYLFPLDSYVKHPVSLMQVVPGDTVETPIWQDYADIIAKYTPQNKNYIQQIERFEFYRQARDAYAIIATGEQALYGNIILQKGVVR